MVDLSYSEECNIATVKSPTDIHTTLTSLQQQETIVTQRLDNLIASHTTLSRELNRLDLIYPSLETQIASTRPTNSMLSSTSLAADRILGSVKCLDQEQSNVRATLNAVEYVAELKSCVLGIHRSMGAQDWETAADYLAQANKIPSEFIESGFAEEIVPTAEVPDLPRVTLKSAADSLCTLFLREFERATQNGDEVQVTKYFKLFPLICRRDIGLDAYGRYICEGVALRARTNLSLSMEGCFHAKTITKLFEHIAEIVDGHEHLVERYYGPGTMAKIIECLQTEADVQGCVVLDAWYAEHSINHKLRDIKSYAFSFLDESFSSPLKTTAETLRSESLVSTDQSTGEGGTISMKVIDNLLRESSLILERWAQYLYFMSSKFVPDGAREHSMTIPEFLAASSLCDKISTHMTEPFNAMTTFFFRRSIEIAFQTDQFPAGLSLDPTRPLGTDPPFITSAVDTIMYILDQVLQRCLATFQLPVVSSVVPAISRIVSSDFLTIIQRKLNESYPKPLIQGDMPPEGKVITFLVLINNLDIANEYIRRIIELQLNRQDRSSGPALRDIFHFGDDAKVVEEYLKALEYSFTTKSGELLDHSINVAFHNIIKPRMRPILTEAFRGVDYKPSDNQDDDGSDIVKLRFERNWIALIRPIKRILTATSFDRLLNITATYLATLLQNRIKSYYGLVNELGAIRLERDIFGIITAVVMGEKFGLRNAFTKCTQMTLIINMDDDEWEPTFDNTRKGNELEIQWNLTDEERRFARSIVKQSP